MKCIFNNFPLGVCCFNIVDKVVLEAFDNILYVEESVYTAEIRPQEEFVSVTLLLTLIFIKMFLKMKLF